MDTTVPIAVYGATGRMGQAVLRLALLEPRTSIVSALVKPGSPRVGKSLREDFGISAGDLRYAASIEDSASPAVLIDFSSAQAFDDALAAAVARGIPFVSGTTGLVTAQFEALNQAATRIPVLWSANFSIGIAVLARFARDAAKALDGWHCEIAEAHHHSKKDAPSGTALMLGRVVADARGDDFDRVAVRDRTASIGATRSLRDWFCGRSRRRHRRRAHGRVRGRRRAHRAHASRARSGHFRARRTSRGSVDPSAVRGHLLGGRSAGFCKALIARRQASSWRSAAAGFRDSVRD